MGAARHFPVLYFGRPTASVTIEAYRHLVDDVEGMTGDKVGPRTLWTCQVAVTNLLDLRQASSRDALSLTLDDLSSPIDEYEKCQRVAQAAYQLQLHGIITPAAEGRGETLALFEHHLPANELPVVVRRENWAQLPADPRRLRGITGGTARVARRRPSTPTGNDRFRDQPQALRTTLLRPEIAFPDAVATGGGHANSTRAKVTPPSTDFFGTPSAVTTRNDPSRAT